MTAAGTPAPQVGETITTAEGLDALPVGSVVRQKGGGLVWQRYTEGWYADGSCDTWDSDQVRDYGDRQVTVLYRPDAPQPAPTDEAVLDLENEVELLREQVRVRRSHARDHAIAHHGAVPWTDAERAEGLVPIIKHEHGPLCKNPDAERLWAAVDALCREWEGHFDTEVEEVARLRAILGAHAAPVPASDGPSWGFGRRIEVTP